MIKKLFIICLFISIPLNVSATDSSTKITMLTEVYPPYNMLLDGQLQGISVDILEAMLKVMQTDQTREDFILTNWSRAYTLAKKRKNHMVFAATRTKKRESIFKWVGPITQTTIGITALKEKNIIINKIEDLNKYRIGTVLKGVGEQLLLELGVNKKQLHSISGQNVIDLSFNKMKKDRIDMFAYEVNVASYEATLKGYNMDNFEVVYTLKQGELYYAFNKKTDDKLITQYQKALDTIKSNGLYRKIIEKY